MPQIGDIKVNWNKWHFKLIWHACVDCGKERWVHLVKGKPVSLRCRSCANQGKNLKNGQKTVLGYVFLLCKEHPKADNWGYVKRSRLVLEEKLGRYLLPGMVPHHLNGIRHDDRPENLMEILISEHTANIYRQRKGA